MIINSSGEVALYPVYDKGLISAEISKKLKKRKCAQVGHISEWALKKYFSSMRDKKIQKKFKLLAVCGVEKNKEDAIESLIKGVIENGSPEEMKESARFLVQKISSEEILYFHVNDDCTLPQEVYDMKFQAIINHSKNTTHLGYIIDAIKHRKDVLCEKPLVPVLDFKGNPTCEYIERLEAIVASADEDLILMDAEHYSYKKASIIFYENLEHILKDEKGERRKIKSIEGELLEIDNPCKWRTRAVLSKENQTGLLGDTMVHLLSFISNLKGKATPIYREYSQFEGKEVRYDVDTYDAVDYRIEDTGRGIFTKDSKAHLEVAKFIDKAEGKESKKITFVLDDDSRVILDLKEGSVIKTKNGKTEHYNERSIVSSNEYVNILNHFYNCLSTGQEPLTSFGNSLLTLRAIYESYLIGEEVKIYN